MSNIAVVLKISPSLHLLWGYTTESLIEILVQAAKKGFTCIPSRIFGMCHRTSIAVSSSARFQSHCYCSRWNIWVISVLLAAWAILLRRTISKAPLSILLCTFLVWVSAYRRLWDSFWWMVCSTNILKHGVGGWCTIYMCQVALLGGKKGEKSL